MAWFAHLDGRCESSGFLQRQNCSQLPTLQLEGLSAIAQLAISIGSSETSQRKRLQLEQHCSHAQLIMHHVHMWSAQQLVFQLLRSHASAPCMLSDICCLQAFVVHACNCMHAFLHLLLNRLFWPWFWRLRFWDCDYDYIAMCNQLQSITITIIVSPNPGASLDLGQRRHTWQSHANGSLLLCVRQVTSKRLY